jgi:hypothetical protein
MKMRQTAIVGGYLLVGLMTFGSLFNARYEPRRGDCGPRPNSFEEPHAWMDWFDCENPDDPFVAAFPAIIAGATWPVYWAGRGAIWATAPHQGEVGR